MRQRPKVLSHTSGARHAACIFLDTHTLHYSELILNVAAHTLFMGEEQLLCLQMSGGLACSLTNL